MITLVILSIFNYNRIKFEYFVWDLSSENEIKREQAAEEIIKMGDIAIPYLINKLDKQFIFETDYVVYCLEEITHANTYNRDKADFYKEVIPFWKQWWKVNSYKFKNYF